MIRTNSQAQYHDYELWLEAKQPEIDAIVMGIKPMLDFIYPEPAMPEPRDLDVRPPPPDALVERCKVYLTRFKAFTLSAACSSAGHALAMVRS